MRQARHQRVTSLQSNKENQIIAHNSNANMNLPSLRNNNKSSLKNQYHLNLNKKKKTYINLCAKKDISGRNNLSKNNYGSKKVIQTSRLPSNQTLSSQLSGIYLSSRCDKGSFKSVQKLASIQKYKILQRHQINCRMRAKMVDWLLQIVQAYKCKTQTFFLSIHLMDEYFKHSQRPLLLTQLHLIGVTCIYMACKYEQIHPIRMKTLLKDIAHNKISMKEIVNRESQILHAINFKFERKCLYLIGQQLLSQFDCLIPIQQLNLLKQHLQFYFKLMVFDCDLIRMQEKSILAKAAILTSLKSVSQISKFIPLQNAITESTQKQNQTIIYHICNQIVFLNVNFKSEFGHLQNINKLCPFKNKNLMIQPNA